MSRRFGRQQKRKMRAALSAMTCDISMLHQVNARARRALVDIEQRLKEFLSMLPENSVFKPLRAVDYVRVDYPYLNIDRAATLSSFEVTSENFAEQVKHVERVPLVHIFALLEQNAESFTYDIWLRAKATDPEQDKGYVFSMTRDAFMRSTQAAKAHLSEHIVRQVERSFWPRARIETVA